MNVYQDSLDPKLPSVLIGVVAVSAGYLSLYLPETKGQSLPHSLQDGEHFGQGDTFFTGFLRRNNQPNSGSTNPAFIT